MFWAVFFFFVFFFPHVGTFVVERAGGGVHGFSPTVAVLQRTLFQRKEHGYDRVLYESKRIYATGKAGTPVTTATLAVVFSCSLFPPFASTSRSRPWPLHCYCGVPRSPVD